MKDIESLLGMNISNLALNHQIITRYMEDRMYSNAIAQYVNAKSTTRKGLRVLIAFLETMRQLADKPFHILLGEFFLGVQQYFFGGAELNDLTHVHKDDVI